MTDKEIIQKLIDRDNRVTQEFFFKHCKPLFQSIIRNVFDYQMDYNEFVNELYQHLMENDARRLKTFKFSSSLYGWLKTVAIRYFLDKKNHDRLIVPGGKETPAKKEGNDTTLENTIETSMDVERLLAAMSSKRYAYVIEKLILEDVPPEELAAEMNIKIANLYNLKKRAIKQLTLVALKDIKKYKKQR
ncbi:MAG: sigma-70 family RNA polymerase sigma factor [Bacteroidales bacterium]|nr:sigma-70 family RNA polymerase sigma factor [Bacteroidales bacterium]